MGSYVNYVILWEAMNKVEVILQNLLNLIELMEFYGICGISWDI